MTFQRQRFHISSFSTSFSIVSAFISNIGLRKVSLCMKLDITRRLHFELRDKETTSEQVNKVTVLMLLSYPSALISEESSF